MGFWENVEDEMKYQGISRKELACKANISYAGIGLGLERDSMPGADTALRISKVLNVSIEYLLCGTEEKADKTESHISLAKYKPVISELESLPAEIREPVLDLIHKLSRNAS